MKNERTKPMEQRELISFLGIIEKLKCNTRHSWTSSGRKESVAEHSWRVSVMALLMRDEFPDADIEKVVKMCLIHDLGEALTGDIPSFDKTEEDEKSEKKAISVLLSKLPQTYKDEFEVLFIEIEEHKTLEARLFKALDNMEAVISHNEAPLSTWLQLEYEENLKYGAENVAFSDYLTELKAQINQDSISKIKQGS